jgi:hypothetical protein
MAPPADAVLAFISAFPLIILGAVLLLLRPRRASQLFFGGFAVLLGARIALFNIGRVLVDPDVHYTFTMLGQTLTGPLVLFLVHFVVTLRRPRWGWFASGTAALFAIAATVVLLMRPDLVVQEVRLDNEELSLVRGPLSFPLFVAPYFAATFLAVLVLYLEYRRVPPGTPRHRVRGVLLALAVFASYSAVRYAVAFYASRDGIAAFSSSTVETADTLSQLAQPTFFLLGALLMAGILVHLSLRPPPPQGHDTPLIFAFAFPAAVAVAEHLFGLYRITLETVGFWRLLSVGILTYTLAQYQLFDLDLKLKRLAGPAVAGVLLLFGVPIALSLALGEFGTRAMIFTIVPQIVGIAGVAVFHDRIEKALFPGVRNTPDYVHQRKFEIYRVALEEALARGAAPDDEELRELRLRHGISDEEHQVLTWTLSPRLREAADAGAEAFEVGQTVLDRYRLDRLLGHGTHGRTFLASDARTRTQVALKTVSTSALDGAAARLLLREARLAASLHHPNVIQILDVAEVPGRVVVVMEYADNGNLEAYLARRGRFPLPEAVRFLRELLEALEVVHRKGIVHRNLKPKNILVEADGSVRLADFGAAHGRGRAAEDAASQTLLDLLYQSPEQVGGQAATARSDLYVAAVLFHQVLTRRHVLPLAGRSDPQIRDALLHAPLELHVGDQPPWVRSLLLVALDRNPERRFHSAADMRKALEQAAGL